MGYKKIIIEESDENPEHIHQETDENYIPGRGEAFSMGMVSGWTSANKVMPFVLIAVLLVFMFVC